MLQLFVFNRKHIPRKGENNLLVLCRILCGVMNASLAMVDVDSFTPYFYCNNNVLSCRSCKKNFPYMYRNIYVLYVSSNNGLAQAALGKCQ